MIRNQMNEILDALPESELEKLYWPLVSIHKNYLFRKNVTDKGVLISEVLEDSQKIIDSWDRAFAQNISLDVKESIYYNQFKWHIFSYKKQDCLIDYLAREAFDAASKDELYVMYQNSPDVWLYSHANQVVSADFDSEQDIYVFDKNFSWTYVHTHESMCGPYFYSKS